MSISNIKVLLLLLLGAVVPVFAADNNDGELERFSAGHINIFLEIRERIRAGVVQTNLNSANSEFQNIISFSLIENLKQGSSATFPFCIISSGGGSFEIDFYNEQNSSQNALKSEFGMSMPFDVVIGEPDESSLKVRSVSEECDVNSAIPLTIKLNEELNGEEISSINGKLNLLVKTE
jgi:hypothetical protein